MNSVAKLVPTNAIPGLVSLTEKDIRTLERLRKLLRKQESALRATITELGELGAHVKARHGNQNFTMAEIEFTFSQLK